MEQKGRPFAGPKYRILIVGGGSAGWMTASYLTKAFGESVDIRLTESPNIGTIGVGEATFSDIHLFFEFLGLQESNWMPHCNASYKLAIRFMNWNAEKRHFYHPFQRFDVVHGRSIIEWWLKLNRDRARFDYACFTVPGICDARRSPRFMDGRPFDSKVTGQLGPNGAADKPWLMDDLPIQYPYAYHFDASLLAKFLSRYAQSRGVVRLLDDVVDIEMAEDRAIRGVRTRKHGLLEADLFIDCTGFRGLLINQTLKEPFIAFGESLPCDCAVAMQVPHDGVTEGLKPYTTATALTAGWAWDIPLYHRTGTGYVYSSAFITPEAAETEFRKHLGPRADECSALHIKMRVGRNRNSWVRNCVAIGLASGFVEPLESTGIFFIHHAVEQLVNHFPRHAPDEESVRSYNKAVGDCIDGVREFLTLHYVASTRSDTPFWKATKHDLLVPEALAERMRLWKTRLPSKRSINPNYHGFPPYSYCVMLLGLGHWPEQSLPALDYLDDSAALDTFDEIRERTEHLKATLPPLHDYLSALYNGERAAVATG